MHSSFSSHPISSDGTEWEIVCWQRNPCGPCLHCRRNKTLRQPTRETLRLPPLSSTMVSGCPSSPSQVSFLLIHLCRSVYPGILRACCWQRWVVVLVSRGVPRPGAWHGARCLPSFEGRDVLQGCHFCSVVHASLDRFSQPGFNPANCIQRPLFRFAGTWPAFTMSGFWSTSARFLDSLLCMGAGLSLKRCVLVKNDRHIAWFLP